jgi:hypothetical protein
MANMIEVKVPDIGGHDNVPVIEVMVKVGDTVAKEHGDSLQHRRRDQGIQTQGW